MNPKLSHDEIRMRDMKKVSRRLMQAFAGLEFEDFENEATRDKIVWLMQGMIEYLERQVEQAKLLLKGEMNDSEH